jgi:hypothetical protein
MFCGVLKQLICVKRIQRNLTVPTIECRSCSRAYGAREMKGIPELEFFSTVSVVKMGAEGGVFW